MVRIDKIVTKAGDGGKTRLATGEEVAKSSVRIEAIGCVDETNSALGVAIANTRESSPLHFILTRVQNDLFDLGADLATPEREAPLAFTPLRVSETQVERLENEIDALNEDIAPLTSFVLPGGAPPSAGAYLHLARALSRRAERAIVRLKESEQVSDAALKYANRLSDLLFVAARYANDKGKSDVLWVPGANR
jgi:cob(I)alamin adenosyltransferase